MPPPLGRGEQPPLPHIAASGLSIAPSPVRRPDERPAPQSAPRSSGIALLGIVARTAHTAARVVGDGEAKAHQALAALAIAAGRHEQARTHLGRALDIYERLRDPDVAEACQLATLIPPADADPHRMA